MPSFTTQNDNLQERGPIVGLRVSVPRDVECALKKAGKEVPAPIALLGLIDTGAAKTVIQKGIATRLGLEPQGAADIHTVSSGSLQCYEYAVQLIFTNGVTVAGTVIETPKIDHDIQMLIGRDILAHSVLVYLGYSNTFSLSF